MPYIFKVLPSNYNSSLVHLFSESENKHENLNKEKQKENESLQPLPQNSADLGQEGNSSSWSLFFLASCIIFVFSRQFTDCWILLYIKKKEKKKSKSSRPVENVTPFLFVKAYGILPIDQNSMCKRQYLH